MEKSNENFAIMDKIFAKIRSKISSKNIEIREHFEENDRIKTSMETLYLIAPLKSYMFPIITSLLEELMRRANMF